MGPDMIVSDLVEPPGSTPDNPPGIITAETSSNYRAALSKAFCARWYPQVTEREWTNWRWQLRNVINSFVQLQQMFNISEQEVCSKLPMRITPYYASLMDPEDPADPLRKTMIPSYQETVLSKGEEADPLHEEDQSPLPTLVHRYPDRVLFLTTNTCASFCRYCTRSRVVGDCHKANIYSRQSWADNIAYIRDHTKIRDVLLSGGDPLTLDDDTLDDLLSAIRDIPHVEMVRIGTKAPMVLPQRITLQLVKMLKQHHPLYMSIHCTHPDELTSECSSALQRLADAGIPLGSQTVLLKGVNDNVDTMKALYHGLLKNRVRPYYLYQGDSIIGSSHFRTTVTKGLEIMKGLRGHTTGYAVPTYVIDAPKGGGKIPVSMKTVLAHTKEKVVLQNYEGKIFEYPLSGLV